LTKNGDPEMQWSAEAERALKKVPFFVRPRIRKRVENEAAVEGKNIISITQVQATQQRYLSGGMAAEVKGYQLDACFGTGGCPNRVLDSQSLMAELEARLQGENLLGFLQRSVPGGLKFHHEFRVTLADCPNACSQPQIKDLGIIAAQLPSVSDRTCSDCGACEDACREDAIRLNGHPPAPRIDTIRCLACGRCVPVCPTGTLIEGPRGFRVQLGGKLGRHPRLARELEGLYSAGGVLAIVKDCLVLYRQKSKGGQRFADILTPSDLDALGRRHPPEHARGG
jgi:anaerobic sulfite reductase subunit C